MSPYQYSAVSERDFRILELNPGKGDDPLEGQLLIRPIDPYIEESKTHSDELPETEESYEAISYVWGSNDKPQVLNTPSGSVPITDSLYRCLKRVRLPDTKRLVWADAICINQADNKEKETQILLMRHIYSSAIRVLAYLGEEADDSSAAIDLIERYWHYYIPQPANAGVRAFVEDMFQKPVPDADPKNAAFPPKDDQKWLPVSKFWNRPWFRRIWIVQEFILARDVLIICGPKTVNWSQIWPATIALEEPEVPPWPLVDSHGKAIESAADLMANMAQRLRFYQLGAMRGNPRDHGHDHDHDHGHDCGHDHDHDHDHGHGEHAHPEDDENEEEEEEDKDGSNEGSDADEQDWESASEDDDVSKQPTDLLSLLLSFREVDATDPRDFYFALLGLASDGDKPEFRPDYSATFEATALRFGKALFHDPFSEELLDHAGLAINGASFPSWLPDFRRSWRRMTVADAAESDAAGESDFDFGVDLDADDVLLLKGRKFDTIKAMSGVPRPAHILADHPSLWVKRDMVTLEDFINSTAGLQKQYPTKQPRLDAILRTLTFFRTEADESEIPISTLQLAWRYCIAVKEDNLDPERPERDLLRKEIMFSGKVQTSQEANEALQAATNIFLNRVYHTRQALDLVLCSTEGSYVAMVPDMSEAGDEIWVLKGCNAPFVLRKSADRDGMYRIIGAAYLHGIMDGEALEQKGFDFEPVSIY